MKSIQQRNKYICNKSIQLGKITDAHKHTRRLSRIATYQELLTVMVVKHAKNELKRVFKE